MPLVYDKFPPTAEDVHYDPAFVSSVNGSHGDEMVDDVVMFSIGTTDAHTFATDIVRDDEGFIDLGDVRRGLNSAGSVLVEPARRQYEKGVKFFIAKSLAQARSAV